MAMAARTNTTRARFIGFSTASTRHAAPGTRHPAPGTWPPAPVHSPLRSPHSGRLQTIKGDHVERLRRRHAKLPQHRRYLTSMIATVVDHVLQHLPERCDTGLT